MSEEKRNSAKSGKRFGARSKQAPRKTYKQTDNSKTGTRTQKYRGKKRYSANSRKPGQKSTRSQMTSTVKSFVQTKYDKPERACDLVTNGGSAGLLVELQSILTLAKRFTFKSLAGTGFGAVSASLAAAAEYGRRQKSGNHFQELVTILSSLSEDKNANGLHELLKPSKKTRSYLNFIKELFDKNKKSGVFSIAKHASAQNPLITFASLLPALAGVATAFIPGLGVGAIVSLVCGLLLSILAVPFFNTIAFSKGFSKALDINGFALCNGKDDLMPWLILHINSLAGITSQNNYLTFGTLLTPFEEQENEINLKLVATDITMRQPMTLPFNKEVLNDAERRYYFKEEELKQYFPADMVSYLVNKAPGDRRFRKVRDLIPLPDSEDLPVAFAARLSLSLPLVLSAIPLWKIRRVKIRGELRWKSYKCLISGGGLSAKPGVDYFDSPLPARPTFLLHVTPILDPSADDDDKHGIWIQNQISQGGPVMIQNIKSIKDFARACSFSMTNWRDNALMHMPGYMERTALIKIPAHMAGPLPTLSKDDCNTLRQLGENVALQLITRYLGKEQHPRALSWEGHRWVRFRAQMAALERYLIAFKESYFDSDQNDSTFNSLIMRGEKDSPDAFRWDGPGQRNHALRVTNQLLNLIERWQEDQLSFDSGDVPKPGGRLAIREDY